MSREATASGDNLRVTNPSQIADFTAFTYAVWIYKKSTVGGLGTTVPRIISKFGSSAERKRILLSSGRIVGVVSRQTTNAQATAASGPAVNTWVHVAMTYDETNGVRIYYDGTEVTYLTTPTIGAGTTLTDSGGDLSFANMNNGSNTYDGRLAEIRIWNRILSDSELSVLATRSYTPRLISSGLVGAWRLLGDNSPEPDSINGNSAAVTGAIQASHPPGIIIALPERTTRLGSHRGELLRMG